MASSRMVAVLSRQQQKQKRKTSEKEKALRRNERTTSSFFLLLLLLLVPLLRSSRSVTRSERHDELRSRRPVRCRRRRLFSSLDRSRIFL